MEGWFTLQGREQTPQGYLKERGPGLVSKSPERIRIQVSHEAVPDFERHLILRMELFLTLGLGLSNFVGF